MSKELQKMKQQEVTQPEVDIKQPEVDQPDQPEVN